MNIAPKCSKTFLRLRQVDPTIRDGCVLQSYALPKLLQSPCGCGAARPLQRKGRKSGTVTALIYAQMPGFSQETSYMLTQTRRHAMLTMAATAWGLHMPSAHASNTSRAFGGSTLPPTMQVAGRNLRLNGAGIRYRAMFQVYTVGLYMEQFAATPEEVTQAPGVKRIAAIMLRTVNATELGNMFTTAIINNNAGNVTTQLLPDIARISDVFSRVKTLREGEHFSADRVPGKGMVLNVRGEPQPEPFDENFFDALAQIWLGPRPPDPALKKALLGVDPYVNTGASVPTN